MFPMLIPLAVNTLMCLINSAKQILQMHVILYELRRQEINPLACNTLGKSTDKTIPGIDKYSQAIKENAKEKKERS